MRIILFVLALFSFSANAATVYAPVPEDFKACVTNADCVLVDHDCNDCCGQEAINKNKLEEYKNLKFKICQSYKGAVCDCAPMQVNAACENLRCTLESKPSPNGSLPTK